MSGQQKAILIDVASAVAVHAIYRKYEIDPASAFPTIALLFGVPSVATYLLSSYASPSIAAFVGFGVFYAALLSSIVLYRISPFHPLASYPGPFLAKISKFYALRVMATGKNHIHHKELHEKYGPYVRVGPNELSVVDGDRISDILGASGLPRGPMWDGRRDPSGTRSLISIRDQREHSRRRKPWNRAFSSTAVKDYEPNVQRRALQLMRELEKRAKEAEVVNLSEWMKAFTFDFMGDLVFGGVFETMRDGVHSQPLFQVIENGVKFMALIHHVPWIIKLLYLLPGSAKSITNLRAGAADQVKKRRTEGSHAKDVYSYFIDEGSEKERPTEAELIADGLLAILAGYDTTATVLAALFYYVLEDRVVYARLQEEVDGYFQAADGTLLDSSKLAGLPYLNAVINEALRLGNAANILQRSTTSETGGKWLGSNYIPAGTSIQIPVYALFRSPKYFSPAPEEFRPERFLTESGAGDGTGSKENAKTNLAAFIPFSYGPENCAGRALALAELRVVALLMVHHFDMKLADGYDARDWQAHLEDWYIMSIGEVPVRLRLRTPVLD